MSSRWFLVRHATADTPPGTLNGRSDPPIQTPSPQDLEALRARLPSEAQAFHTGLQRTRDTLHLLKPELKAQEVQALAEQDFGAWEGKTWDSLGAESAHFWTDPARNRPPSGESFVDLSLRVSQTLRQLEANHPGEDKLLVAHAGTIRAALALALSLSPAGALRFAIAPLSLTILNAYEDTQDALGWSVACVNT